MQYEEDGAKCYDKCGANTLFLALEVCTLLQGDDYCTSDCEPQITPDYPDY